MSNRIVILGAGASADAQIPTARQMTGKMLEAAANAGVSTKVQHAVRLAVASAIFGQGLRNEDPTGGVNIEDVFNLLDTLANRNRLEASPLIGAWHPVVEQLDRLIVGGAQTPSRESGIVASLNTRDNARGIAESLAELNSDKSPWAVTRLADAIEQVLRPNSGFRSTPRAPEPSREIPADGRVFEQAKKFLFSQLKNLVWVDVARDLGYLTPLLGKANEQHIAIATLNYDNCIERAAARLGIGLDTGIETWREHGEFEFAQVGAIPFLKLHGSITWSRTKDSTGRLPIRRTVISEASDEEIMRESYEPAVIFGGRNKLTVEGPFLDLLRGFRDQLKSATEAVVIGYSFADGHINEYLAQWLNAGEDRVITIVNGGNFRLKANDFARQLFDAPGQRVRTVEERAKKGIAELFG